MMSAADDDAAMNERLILDASEAMTKNRVTVTL